ncbi:hypothetical protein DHEL01_v200534 [Diaporthe helianthi]|uniref:Uncharacterized protein n=1 Tax=Diaporthe helianthi TaxID=158607 RepID=A0A2P5IF04_DIAHE|nr:hypothetical protein DHEL01_v200534 [Diaporthe helianthi]
MAVHRFERALTGNDKWSIFLRQRRLQDLLRRLMNDFKSCYCPPGCQGGPHNHAAADPASLPQQDTHSPYVPVDGRMPGTFGRPEVRGNHDCEVLAEARGTSDILLRRSRTRATLRMSLQLHTDPDQPGRRGYYGEMFLTQRGRPETFMGLIESWHIDRSTRDWEALYLAYNISRPLTIVLEPGGAGAPYDKVWQDPTSGRVMDPAEVINILSRTYARNGFLPLEAGRPEEIFKVMGRRVEPWDHPADPTDMSITPPGPPDAYKVIQKLGDWGYQVIDVDSNYETHQVPVASTYPDAVSNFRVVRIIVPSISQRVVTEVIHFDVTSAAGNTLAITEAWNKINDNRSEGEKLRLREIILAFWVSHLGRAARDLRAITYYDPVENVLRNELFQAIYRSMGRGILTNLTLNRETESPEETRAFNLLLERAPFCIGAHRMLEEFQEFAEVNMKSFEFLPVLSGDSINKTKPRFHFRINFS